MSIFNWGIYGGYGIAFPVGRYIPPLDAWGLVSILSSANYHQNVVKLGRTLLLPLRIIKPLIRPRELPANSWQLAPCNTTNTHDATISKLQTTCLRSRSKNARTHFISTTKTLFSSTYFPVSRELVTRKLLRLTRIYLKIKRAKNMKF